LFIFVTVLSHAEEISEITDLRVIVTGNTVEGKIVKSNASYKMYFHPSGKLVHATKSNIEKGSWKIKSNTELCIKITEVKCHAVKKRGDGEFDLYNPDGELVLTIDKVILGNPDKFDALSGKNKKTVN
jgi:hypothetical protein